LQTFLQRFHLCRQFNNWNDSESYHRLAFSLVDGPAELLWSEELGGPPSVDALVEKLQQSYGTQSQISVYRAQLMSKRQGQESLENYLREVQRLASLAFPGKASKDAEIVVINVLIAGLSNRRLAMKLTEMETTTIQQTIQLAIKYNSFQVAEMQRSGELDRHRPKLQTVREVESDSTVRDMERRLAELEKGSKKKVNTTAHRSTKPAPCLLNGPGYPPSPGRNDLQPASSSHRPSTKTKVTARPQMNGAWNFPPPQRPPSFRGFADRPPAPSTPYAYHCPPLRDHEPPGPTSAVYQPLQTVDGVYVPPPPPPREFTDSSAPYSSANDIGPPPSGRRGNKQKQPGVNGAARGCPECGDPSHGLRLCPYNDETARKECYEETQYYSSEQPMPARSCYVPATESAYLKGSLFGKNTYMLLDSGSQANLVPQKWIRPKDIHPSSQPLLAANNTEILIAGRVEIQLRIGGMVIKTEALVSPQIDSLILGLKWIETHIRSWNFKDRWVELRGKQVPVHVRPEAGRCRRIAAAADVLIPPLSETDVAAYAILPRLEATETPWATHTTALASGLIIAGAVMPGRATDLTMRVLNPTDKTIHLPKGVRCNSEPVAVVERVKEEEKPLSCTNIRQVAPEEAERVLEPLWKNVPEEIPDSVKERLREIILSRHKAFSLSEWDLGFTSILQHEIDTGNELPVRQPLRRQPLTQLAVIDSQIDVMLANDVIERSYSDWASNVVMVTKRDGGVRFCIDYRHLNTKTKKDSYPLPLISECLDVLGGSQWYSTIDLRSGYFQLAIHPKDRHKTAFLTRRGSWQFKRLAFGLTGSPASFSRMMGLVMAGLNFAICLIYLDDIIIFAADLDTHLERLTQVLDRLAEANLKLKPSKCFLLQRRVLFLGHIVSGEGVETDPAKIEAVQDWPTPKKLREVRGFLGLCSYYRKFVPDFAQIARPLHDLTKKEVKFTWTDECEQAFQKLKKKLTEAPILALPTDEDMYILDTDASLESIGAVLSQVQSGEEKVICYGSRVCSPAEKNYDVTRRELLAVIYFLKLYRPYLLGRKFLLRTDHSALQWLRRTPLPIGQQARWLTVMEEFHFDVQHRSGSAHTNADAMSRRPQIVNMVTRGANDQKTSAAIPESWSRATLRDEQLADGEIGWIMRKKTDSADAPSSAEVKKMSATVKLLAAQWPQLEISDGLLIRRWLDAENIQVRWRQLVLPPSRRIPMIQLCHTGMTGAHLGFRRTSAHLQRRAYWPGWRKDVQLQLARCTPCARYTRTQPGRQGPLQNMVAGEAGETLSLDHTGPHPTSSGGHKFILTMIDHFSKYAEAFPVRNQEAKTTARVLVDNWISRYGCPLQILTDQGSGFESELFQELCVLLNVQKLRTSSFKASTNGTLERLHRTLNSLLAKVISKDHRNWHLLLPYLMCAYRASIHSSSGFTPNKLFLGREVCLPVDIVIGECLDREAHTTSYPEYVHEQEQRMKVAFSLAREHMQKQAELRAYRYDLRVKPKEYLPNQLVLYYYPRKRPGLKDKWSSWFTGPFMVEKKVGPVLYQIRKTPRSQAKLVYVDKLKLYKGPVPKEWGGDEPEVENPFNDLLDDFEEPEEIRPRRQTRAPVRYGFDD